MTVRNPPVRRRPRRSNSLKDIGRLLGIAGTAYEEDRKDRLLAKVRKLSDTEGNACSNYFKIQTANLFLRQFGVQFVANDRVLHILEERPGAIGAAWLDDGPAGDALRYLRAQALDRGAAAQDKRLATDSRAKENAEIMKLREADAAFLAKCEDAEKLSLKCAELMGRSRGHDWAVPWQEVAVSGSKPPDEG